MKSCLYRDNCIYYIVIVIDLKSCDEYCCFFDKKLDFDMNDNGKLPNPIYPLNNDVKITIRRKIDYLCYKKT